ncbi:MAG: cupin domain-containing protein [Chitinophagales bacterium]
MKNAIIELAYNKIKTNKFYKNSDLECIVISIEKGEKLKKHTSPKPACIIVLEGAIDFDILGETHYLVAHQTFEFDKNVEHEVLAKENAKFVLIR